MEQKQTSIPKIIHYIWIGEKELPKSALKCIESWKKYCPDYEIKKWTEKDIDIESNKFMKSAYKNKKWSFVTDVARCEIIYKYGGFYFDTDVELVKNLDSLLNLNSFIGFEGTRYVNTGSGFGAKKGDPVIKNFLDLYKKINYSFASDKNLNEITTPVLLTNYLEKRGLKRNGEKQIIDGMTIFPSEYFNPKNPITRFIEITDKTYSIHHFDASWTNKKEKKYIENLEKNVKKLIKNQKDKVSIIIPVYNGQNYLRKAIDSALNQTYKNLEVIVVNDGSTDNTEKIALSYDNRIKYYYKENGGVASALNYGIRKMTGKYFSWLSHDDEYDLKKIEKQVKHLLNKDEKVISVCNWLIINKDSKVIEKKYISKKLEKFPQEFLAFDRKTWLNGCAMLINKKCFDICGLFNETLPTTQDYDLWNRFAEKCKFEILDNHLLFSRAHSEQGSLTVSTALNDSDLMHYNIMKKLKIENIYEYFDNDADELIEVFNSFYNSGYKRAPAEILRMLKYFYLNNILEYDDFIQEKVLNFNNKNLSNYLSENSSKKRIMFVTAHWYKGGVERVLCKLFEHLIKEYDIYLVMPYTKQKGYSINEKINVIYISDNVFYNTLDFALFYLYDYLKLDAIIGCMNLFDKMLNYYFLTVGTDQKAIASNHEYILYPFKNIYFKKIITKRFESFKKISAVIWLTNYSNFVYSQIAKNGIVIPNPNTFDINEKTINKKENIVLCVGRFYDYIKRVDRVIECFSKIVKEVPNSKLILLGKYDNSTIVDKKNNLNLIQLINKYGLSNENVELVGEKSDVSSYYKKAKVLLIASENEGFPMVINEAAQYHTITIGMYFPGLEDLIVDNENGYVVEQGDIDKMANLTIELLKNDDLAKKLSIKAYNFSKKYKSDLVAKMWVKLLNDVIEKNKNDFKIKNISEDGNKNFDMKNFFEVTCKELFDISKILSSQINEEKLEKSTLISNIENLDEINRLKKENNDLRYQLNVIKNSRSWKITKPLRGKFVKK